MARSALRTRRRVVRLALFALGAGVALAAWVYAGLPARAEVRALAKRNPGKTRLMLEREEQARERGRRPRPAQQAFVPLAQVSRHLIHAVIASEDQAFFGHEGVDWKAIRESLERNVERGRFARGGSTITQQLAKNLYFGTSKTPLRKLRELVVTRWLEADLPKARILELYLNVIEWGDAVYGCEAASRHWYARPASQLSAAEAAGLAAMIPNPRRINPRAAPARHDRATKRVLWLMQLAGYIGRDVAPLGAVPPEEPALDDLDDAEAEEAQDAALQAAPNVEPLPGLERSPEPSPTPSPTPPPGPSQAPPPEPPAGPGVPFSP